MKITTLPYTHKLKGLMWLLCGCTISVGALFTIPFLFVLAGFGFMGAVALELVLPRKPIALPPPAEKPVVPLSVAEALERAAKKLPKVEGEERERIQQLREFLQITHRYKGNPRLSREDTECLKP